MASNLTPEDLDRLSTQFNAQSNIYAPVALDDALGLLAAARREAKLRDALEKSVAALRRLLYPAVPSGTDVRVLIRTSPCTNFETQEKAMPIADRLDAAQANAEKVIALTRLALAHDGRSA